MSGSLSLTGYYITEQSQVFLFNAGSEVYLRIAGQQWTGTDIDWNKITTTAHYFHYNSHHHYHYYHFHYHCKMHLYRLKILLTILFIVIWSPVCFNWILSSFYRYVFFFYYIIFFVFLHPVKRVRISLRTIRRILDVLFIPLIYSYS